MKHLLTVYFLALGFFGFSQKISFLDLVPELNSIKTEQHILFDFDKPVLRPESYIYLDSLVAFMKVQKPVLIQVGNHGDSRVSKSYCARLT
ncbi:MAG: outer membrane protein OmpA-like peptidoglycan-associated protein [Parvicellaceae bacterium]|jgi:outer membrane protein OmpA-like peptidoglycan-associated protein